MEKSSDWMENQNELGCEHGKAMDERWMGRYGQISSNLI